MGDYKDEITTYKASNVLKHKTGWYYTKSHLLSSWFELYIPQRVWLVPS